MTINIIVNGAKGKMGAITAETIKQNKQFTLVAALDHDDNLADAIQKHQAKIVIDFTIPSTVYENTKTIIQNGAHPIIGTTGLSDTQIAELSNLCEQKKLGGIIAPNFSLGALLMMRYAADAAKYFPECEIIERHHEKKLDAPSGTALKTADLMRNKPASSISNELKNHPARGELHHDIPIHSVRLPGYFAHQTVIFGGVGEVLTIRHDAMTREAMMPGVVLACQKVLELDRMIYGLEQLL